MGILDSIVEWIATQVMNLLDLITGSVLGALGCDMSTFLRYFPAAETLYEIFVAIGVGFILLNLVWQLFRNFGLGLGLSAEDPVKLAIKSILFIFLALFADQISVVASFTAQPTADPPVFSQTATAPKSTQPAQQQVQPPVQQSHAPAPEPPKTLDEYLRVMTIEQAKAVKVDFGRFSGWSLGEIAMKSPGDLAWYVKNYSGHNLALKAGATKLLETVGQMAS